MTPEKFCYWLQGYVEVGNTKAPTEEEWLVIKDHLKLVFSKVTPERSHVGPTLSPASFFEKFHETPKITC